MDGTASPNQVEALVSLIADDNPRVREACLEEARRLGPVVVEPLRRQSRSTEDAVLRRASMRLLRKLQIQADLDEFRRLRAAGQPMLEYGVEALARIHDPLLEPGALSRRLDEIAVRLRPRVPPGASIRSAIGVLSAFVHHDLGLRGGDENYYDPLNSFMHKVLERGIGIPISLSAAYLLLARRVDLPLLGFSIPGHFLTGYRYEGEYEFIDAFAQGRRLDIEHVLEIARSHGFHMPAAEVRPASDRDIVVRMMNNLVVILEREDPEGWLEQVRPLRLSLLRPIGAQA